jgi:tetratricopeptide (TPR) repeat protein
MSRLRRGHWVVLLFFLLAVLIATGFWFWQARPSRQEWQQVEAAFQRHDLATAAVHLDRYLKHRPHDADAWLLAGRTARRLDRFIKAEEYLIRCQELAGITDATRLEWDLLRIQQGDLGDVHSRLRMTITPDHPDAPLVLEALARGYIATDRLRDALDACDLWVDRQPNHPGPWFWRGTILERLGHNSQAMPDYQRAMELAPQDREVRLAVARQFDMFRQPNSAAEQYEYLLARDPDDVEALLGMAECWIERGRPADAVPLLNQVMARNPIPAAGYFLRGRVALELNDAPAAEQWLTRAVDESPDNAEAWHHLILSLRAQGKSVEADRLAPRLEAIRQDLQRLSEMIASVALHPDEVGPRHEAGVVALRLGRYDEGVRWLQSALRARGDHRSTHAALAEHFESRGDPRAQAHRRAAGQTP